MALSSSTLLDVVNHILLMIGERQVTSLNSPTAILAKNSIIDAVNDISTVHDFSWLRVTMPAISWLGNRASLGDVTRIWSVVAGTTSLGFHELRYVTPDVFDTLSIEGYTTGITNPYWAYWWTRVGHNEVAITPYPMDATSQAQVLFRVTKAFAVPSIATDKFDMPQQYITLLHYRAASDMALNHLDDANLAAQFMAKYEVLAQRLRGRDVIVPAEGLTIRRRGRR